MLAFVVRRLVLGLVVLVAVSFVSFWFFARNFYVAGGTLLPESPQRAWWQWFTGIPHGTLGRGMFGQDLWPQLLPALERTGWLIGESLVLVIAGSLAIGILGATRQRSTLDVVLRAVSYASWSLPAFLVALIVQRLFHVNGWPSHDVPYHLLVPAATLATSFVGLYARFVRSSLVVALAAPYTTTARAKGLPERLVVLRHALRNALATYVSILLLELGSVFGAAMAVDWVFNLGGVGSLFLHTIGGQSIDPSAVQLIIVVTAAFVLTASLLADLAVVWLDPRVQAR